MTACEHFIVLYPFDSVGRQGVCAECRATVETDIQGAYSPVFAAVRFSQADLDQLRRRRSAR